MAWEDLSGWISAGISTVAAAISWSTFLATKAQADSAKEQARLAREANAFAQQESAKEDGLKKKQLALQLARDWCTIEAPSPFSLLRGWLGENNNSKAVESILRVEAITVSAVYNDQLHAFFQQVLTTWNQSRLDGSGNNKLSQGEVRFIRNYFVRRLNFFEAVLSASSTGLADEELIRSYFDGIILQNASYLHATRFDPEGWPHLKTFFDKSFSNR